MAPLVDMGAPVNVAEAVPAGHTACVLPVTNVPVSKQAELLRPLVVLLQARGLPVSINIGKSLA